MPHAHAHTIPSVDGLSALEDMEEVFSSADDQPLDRETKERALTWLLARFPDEPVAAFSASGFFADMPASIPVGDNPIVIEGRSGLDTTSSESDRQAMIEAWVRMLARGANKYLLHRPGLSDVTCYWLDLQDLHGVVFAVIVGVAPEERDNPAPDAHVMAKPAPRFASMRKDQYAAILSVDEAFTELLGWTSEELGEKRSLDLMHPDDRELATENWMEMLARPGPARRLRQRMLHKDGSWVWFEVTNHNLLGDASYGCITCEMVDISEEMAAHEALRAREQLLDRLTAALPVGVLQIDARRRLVFTNERLADIMGVASAHTLDAQLGNVLAADRARLEHALDSVLGDGANADLDVAVVLPAGGDTRRLRMAIRALSHNDGTASGAIACVDDVTERTRMQDELKRRATYDDLTGCHNRASVMAALEDNLARSTASADRAVMFVDLDSFKDINDLRGHAAGDELLRRVAKRLLGAVRDSDIVGRIGGDEFLIVCPEIGGTEPALRLAERLSEAIAAAGAELRAEPGPASRRPGRDAGADPRSGPGVSIGVTWCAGRGLDADAMVALADRAMYECKRAHTAPPALARPPLAVAVP